MYSSFDLGFEAHRRIMNALPQYNRLLELLENAKSLAGEFEGGYSGEFDSAQEFHLALSNSIERLTNGDNKQLEILYRWFLPTSNWDDFVGNEGQGVANEICGLLAQHIGGIRHSPPSRR